MSVIHKQPRGLVVLMLTATALYWVSLYLYVPTLSTYVESKTQSLTIVGIVLAMYGLWQALVRIPIGIGVDASGRGKPFIVVGLLMASGGALVMGFGESPFALGLGRALTGLAAGTWVPLVSVFYGLFPKERAVLATSLLTLCGFSGRLLATSLNGALNNWGGYSLAFIIAAGASVAAAFIIMATPIERKPPGKPSLASVWKLVVRPDVLLPTMIQVVVMFATWAVTFSFLPILAHDLGAGGVGKSLLVSTNIASLMLGTLCNTLIETRVRHAVTLYLSFAILVGGIIVAAFAGALPVLFVATALMGLGNGFAYPTLMGLSVRRVAESERTTAVGIHQAIYAIGMFTGPWYGGILADAIGIRPMFFVTAGISLAAAYILIAVNARAEARS